MCDQPLTEMSMQRWCSVTSLDALRSALLRADCIRREVAAVLLDEDGEIISVGWNQPRDRNKDCALDCPRASSGVAPYSSYTRGAGRCIAIHAEEMALNGATPEERCNGSMLVTEVPCSDCEQLLIGASLQWRVIGKEEQ